MEFITSRSFELPTTAKEMKNSEWFNMWKRRNFPYNEPLVGDTLYWFETKAKKLVWRTRIAMFDRFPYKSKAEILKRYPKSNESEYFKKGADAGFFVIYRVDPLERLDIQKPENLNFPQMGWLRLDDDESIRWFQRKAEDETTLDEFIVNPKSPIGELLVYLNEKMQGVDPERVKRVLSTTIRKDTPIVRTLKSYYDYRCQFPDCGIRLQTKAGGFYVEVAHVSPVAKGGKSILGNLLVLCPNHHKEFDYGRVTVVEQSRKRLRGDLNGKEFDFKFEFV